MIEHIPCSNAERMQAVCRYIEQHSDEPLTLDDLAAQAAMSRFHFARSFKAVVGVTPKQYVADARLRRFKVALAAARPIDAATYDAGYGSPSRVYEGAVGRLGMTPAQYRRAGAGVAISYAALETPIGLMAIGATDRGVCFVQFGESERELVQRLRSEYSGAQIEPMRQPYHPDFARWVDALVRHLDGERPHLDLPLDIRATAFQLRVWNYLQSIPYGDVRSYGEVAAGIGAPRAARAVARACAGNPLAVVIPCHRVIRNTGDLGGYRWGLARKRTLIDRERAVRTTFGGVELGLREIESMQHDEHSHSHAHADGTQHSHRHGHADSDHKHDHEEHEHEHTHADGTTHSHPHPHSGTEEPHEHDH